MRAGCSAQGRWAAVADSTAKCFLDDIAMTIFNKYFVRNFLIAGFFWCVISSIQPVIDFGWYRGISVGVVEGMLFGLIIAFISVEDYSKPVYPFDIDRSQFAAEEIQSEFQPEEPSYSFIILWSVLIITLASIGIYITRDFVILPVASFLLILSLIAFAYTRFSRMIISQYGIEFRTKLYRIKMTWEEIERIEKRGKRWFLIYHSTKIEAVQIIRKLLIIYEVNRRLKLSSLTYNFPESEMAKAIFYHAKQLPIMSTR